VAIAKNYLSKNEIDVLNRLVTAFIDFAELRALNRTIVTMQEWLVRIDEFLKFVDKPALKSNGRVTHEQAVKRAIEEYNKFREKQDEDYISQFDIALEKYLSGNSD